MHQCPVCPKSFPSPYKLKRHYVIHTDQKPIVSKICGKAFTQSEHLKIRLDKVHHSRPPTDYLQDAILTHKQQPSCDKSSAWIDMHGGSDYTSVPQTVSSQTEWKWETVAHENLLPSSETENPPKHILHVNHGSVTRSNISNVMDPIPQEQGDSANVDMSAHNGYTCKVCLKSFTSSLQLWIHSPTHNKPKQIKRGRESGQTFSKKGHAVVHLQSQEVSSSTSKVTSQHQCPKCQKTFVSPSKLQRHFLIHTGQKPYSCKMCCKTFRQKIHLKNHLSSAKKCSLSAGTERKKQRFCDGRQTSGLQLQSPLQQRPASHRKAVDSSEELELECKISVNAVQDLNQREIKSDEPEQPLNTRSHKSDEHEKKYLTHKDLKPFQCTICNRSFRLEVSLIRHQDIHRNQKEFGSPTTVKMSDSEAIEHLPEPSHADPIDLNIIVKPETWTENCSDLNDSLPQDSELIASGEQQRETCHATSKQQRIKKLHDCHTCSKGFPSLSKLQRHMMTHTGQRPFGCEMCGKRFRQKTHLRVHFRTHLWSKYHKQRSLYINRPPSCTGGFNMRPAADVPVQEMFIDKKRHTGSDVVSMKHVDQTSSTALIQNVNRESNNKLLPHISKKNEVVQMRKVSKVTVKRAQTAKSKQNRCKVQHKCFQCSKCFPSASKLQRHEMVHTGLKPFQCLTCGKAFRQAIHLKIHERTHRERKPSKAVNQQLNIRKLKAKSQQQRYPRINVRMPPQKKSVNVDTSVCSAHNGYTCKVCLKSFTSSLQLWIHSPTHNKPKQLERGRESSQTFSKNAHSKVHLQSQALSSSSSKMTLQHQCPKCLKTFVSPSKLQRHFLIHTGQKPYSCNICCKTFRQKIHLKNHLSSAKKCSLPAGTERKKQRFCDSRQTSCLQPQSSLQQQPASHRKAVDSSEELQLECKISVNAVQDLNHTEIKDEVVEPEQPLNTRSHKSDEQEQQYLTNKDLKPFQCTICNRSFRLEVNLIRHHEIHRNQKDLGSPNAVKMSDSEALSQCQSICHESDEQEQLKDLKRFQCTICNRSFRLEVNLIRHQEIHRNQKELGSPTTLQNSDNVEISDSDEIKHLPEPSHADRFDLNIIVKPETWSENCNDHNDSPPRELITPVEQQREPCHGSSQQQRMNTLHDCHTCSKGFPSLSKLQRHMMTHTGQRPFGCDMCGKRFRQKTHLRIHFRTHLWSKYHKQRSLYINRPPSRIGGFSTRTAADVPVQEMSLHKKDFETHTGSDVVSVKHVNQTPSVAQSDNKLLPRISKKHEVVHSRRVSKMTMKRAQTTKSKQNPCKVQHKCFQCSKCFPSASKLQRHEMIHTGLKPFQCLTCGKAFRQAIHLKIHEGTHRERKQCKPVNQQTNIRKLKVKEGEGISFRVPPQKKSVNTDRTLPDFDGGASNEVRELPRHEIPTTKVNSKKRKLQTCQMCFKDFVSSYKLSRHMVTHSETRPYKCTFCSKTFTQCGCLKTHEHKCRQSNGISCNIQGEMINNHHKDKCTENLIDCTDLNVDATREQPELHYTSVGHYSFTDGDLSYCSEPVDTEWLPVPEVVGIQEENNESEKQQRENCNQATDNYRYSFPSELAFEINKLIQNQNMTAPSLSHDYEHSPHNVEVLCQPEGVTANPDSNTLLSDELVSSVAERQMHPDNWYEPLSVFECDKCTASFKSENDLNQHICSTNVQPKKTEFSLKNRCDICFKYFVSPSKLSRHYVVHTGQRPFRCDICDRTFTQEAHVRTHRLTH